MITVMWVEIVALLVLLQSNLIMDVVMDFLALAVIVEFDDKFASTLKSDPLFKKWIIDKDFDKEKPHALRIDTTTSKSALLNIKENRLKSP